VAQRKELTCDQHRDLAARVKRTEELLCEINMTVSNGLGHSSKAAKLTYRLYLEFCEKLKNELDEALRRDCPEMSDEEKQSLYYGPRAKNKIALIP
jgi:hypothetical protein